MKPEMMSPETRSQFGSIDRKAKSEFKEWLRNKVCPIDGSNQLEASDERLSHVVRGYARQRQRALELAMSELDEILSERDHNSHLGAVESTGKRKE